MTPIRQRAVGPTLALAVAAALAACAAFDGGPIEAARGPYAFTATTVPPETSTLVLPNELVADRLAVRRDQSLDGWVTETVVFANNTATPRENVVAMHTRHGGTGLQRFFRARAVTPMDAATLGARLDEEFPGAGAVSAIGERRNRRGPYNFVTVSYDAEDGGGDAGPGRARCVFAWQVVDLADAGARMLGRHALEYRVCDRERGPERLLDLYDQIAVTPYL